jgi:hypothetical protein
MTGNSLLIRIKITIQFKNNQKIIGIRTASLHETINLFKKLTIARPSCFAPKKSCRHTISIVYVTSFIHDRCHCQSKQSLPCVSQVGGDLQLVVYVLNDAVPSNVNRTSLIFKIS